MRMTSLLTCSTALAVFSLTSIGCGAVDLGTNQDESNLEASPQSGEATATACVSDQQCDKGSFCEFSPGQCGVAFPAASSPLAGKCTIIPDACNFRYEPVCGCDGVTYGNACAAAQSGQNIYTAGECEKPGDDTDGGTDTPPTPTACSSDEACGEGQYCATPPGQCGAEAGTCEPRPDACNLRHQPVCGCNGTTYGNACNAAQDGQNIAAAGECGKP